MDIAKKFGTDADLESGTGITLDFGDGATVTIHRAGGSNQKFDTVFRRVFKPYRQQMAAGTLNNETASRCLAIVYADAVVLDWKGIEIHGEPMPFNRENVLKVFEAAPEFFNMIKTEAEAASNFRDAELEDDLGNSDAV